MSGRSMTMETPITGRVRYGFEPEDLHQEGALGIEQAKLRKPGDWWLAKMVARQRRARHKAKERAWNTMRAPLEAIRKHDPGIQYARILIHEILDLLPYAKRQEVLTAMLSGDWRRIYRAGRVIRRALPGLAGTPSHRTPADERAGERTASTGGRRRIRELALSSTSDRGTGRSL